MQCNRTRAVSNLHDAICLSVVHLEPKLAALLMKLDTSKDQDPALQSKFLTKSCIGGPPALTLQVRGGSKPTEAGLVTRSHVLHHLPVATAWGVRCGTGEDLCTSQEAGGVGKVGHREDQKAGLIVNGGSVVGWGGLWESRGREPLSSLRRWLNYRVGQIFRI